MPARVSPPHDERELEIRADSLSGRTLDEIAHALGVSGPTGGARTKGMIGALIERALGANAASAGVPDFVSLGIELKTIPIDPDGRPRESTFVCSISLADAETAEWTTSRVRAKLAHVLWVPILATPDGAVAQRRVGRPRLWRPTSEQESILRADFEDVMGLIGIGGIEQVTAHAGRWLQVRPKAANGRVRTVAYGADGERIATVPRGFYLRPRFTGAILSSPASVP